MLDFDFCHVLDEQTVRCSGTDLHENIQGRLWVFRRRLVNQKTAYRAQVTVNSGATVTLASGPRTISL